MRARWLFWLGALLTWGCRAEGPIAIAHAADRLDAGAGGGDAAATQCSGPTLAVGDLTLEWQEQEVVRHLELKASHLSLDGVDVGRISGGCVLDPRGRVLRAVDGSGAVHGSGGELLGMLSRRDSIRVDGNWVRIGYVMTDPQQAGSAISDSGDPFIIPVKDPPFAAVGHVDGDVVRTRRTALVLWNLGPTLRAAKP